MKEYDLEHYDDDEGAVDKDGEPLGIFGNVKSLVYHENNDDDPYITMPDNVDDDVEREDLQILDSDNLVLAARIEDEMAHLEVYVYEDEADNLYVHHDIMLPAIPLTVEWLNTPVGKGPIEENSRGNFVAVGTMDPDIEIWDLDIVDCMYPNAILGQGAEDMPNGEKPKKKKKKKKSKKANDDYHVDAVLSLAANRTHRNLLASSSADKTVKLWDLNTTKCAKSYTYHTDKVCSLAWHPKETTVLLSGSYDRTVVAADMRAPDAKVPRWGVESDVEQVRWDPHDPNFFYVSLSVTGLGISLIVVRYQLRMASSTTTMPALLPQIRRRQSQSGLFRHTTSPSRPSTSTLWCPALSPLVRRTRKSSFGMSSPRDRAWLCRGTLASAKCSLRHLRPIRKLVSDWQWQAAKAPFRFGTRPPTQQCDALLPTEWRPPRVKSRRGLLVFKSRIASLIVVRMKMRTAKTAMRDQMAGNPWMRSKAGALSWGCYDGVHRRGDSPVAATIAAAPKGKKAEGIVTEHHGVIGVRSVTLPLEDSQIGTKQSNSEQGKANLH